MFHLKRNADGRSIPVELADDQERRMACERVQQACEPAGGECMQALSVRRRAPVRQPHLSFLSAAGVLQWRWGQSAAREWN